jgi:hypothetical protein
MPPTVSMPERTPPSQMLMELSREVSRLSTTLEHAVPALQMARDDIGGLKLTVREHSTILRLGVWVLGVVGGTVATAVVKMAFF